MKNNINHKLKSNKGLTFVEVLVALFIVTIGLMSLLAYFLSVQQATELAQDKTVATTHVNFILEEMKAKTTLAEITSEDWSAFITSNSLNTLTSEVISITYADAGADPLNVTVQINWQSNSKPNSLNYVTEFTK